MMARTDRLAVLADRLELRRDAQPPLRLPLPSRLDAAAWSAALEALVRAAGAAPRADVDVQAVYARLFVLPHHDALSAEARWAAYAQSRFEALMGEAADGWSIRVVPERPPRPRLAVALPLALLNALAAALGPGLRSVRVDALGRLDALRAREAHFSGAAVEGGERHLVVALFERGVLQRLRQRRSAIAADELCALLRVEWAALGHEGPLPALAIGPGLPADDGWSALAPRTLALV